MDVRGTAILAIIPVLLILTQTPPDVHAITRSDIYHMKNQINDLKDKIESYKNDITNQKRTVQIIEDNLTVLIDKERIANSWDQLTKTGESRNNAIAAFQAVTSAKTDLKNAKDKLDTYLARSNSALITLQQLEKKLEQDEKLIKQNSVIKLQGLTRVIGVELSKTCQTMIINEFDTNCPTYYDLQSLDNSLLASGEFRLIDGFYQRDKPLYNNDHVLYDFEKDFIIIVNPSGNIAKRIKMITIENNMSHYFTAYDMHKNDDNTRTINHIRWVDSCKNAVITAENWQKTLPDTIHYLRTGCTVTGIDTIETIQDEITEVDLTTSPNYQAKWKQESDIIKCKGLCFEY